MVTVTGKGNYTGTIEKEFTIKKVKLQEIRLKYTSATYNGKARKPGVTVTALVNGQTKTLKKGRDYTVTYKNNKKVGTAAVTVKGKGGYKGTLKSAFEITPKNINKTNIVLEYSKTGYTGLAKKPKVTITRVINGEKITLKKNIDYTVNYSNNTKIGRANVIINGIENYVGTLTRHFDIQTIDYLVWAKNIADNDYYVYGHNPPYTYSYSLLVGYALQNCGYIKKVTAKPGEGWLYGLGDKRGLEYALVKAGFKFTSAGDMGAVNNSVKSIESMLRPGDIIWRCDYMAHIGFYMGNGQYIEARGGINADSISIFNDFGYFEGIFRLDNNKLH